MEQGQSMASPLVPRAGQSCGTSAPSGPRHLGCGDGQQELLTLLRAALAGEGLHQGRAEGGVASAFPPSLEWGWEEPGDAVELQSGLGAPPGSRGAAGQCCGVADGLAARCCPGNCLSSPES